MAVSISTDARARQSDLSASPPATRHRTSRWRDPRLSVGVGLVALSALAGASLLAPPSTVGVWAARDALVRGQVVDAGDLVRREIRFEDQTDADRYLSAATALQPGTVLARDVGVGELLPRAALGSGSGSPTTEVPLTVPVEAVPATVRTGAVVDVWVTPDPTLEPIGSSAQEATLIFEAVPVLAVSGGGSALGPGVARQVIVGLDPEQETDLPEALAQLAQGTVVLVRKP